MKIRVKICGVTTEKDAQMVALAGADAIGLNFFPDSPRFIADEYDARKIQAILTPLRVLSIGLFVNPNPDDVAKMVHFVGLDGVQLHGEETPELAEKIRKACNKRIQLWKAYRIGSDADVKNVIKEDFPCDALLLDARVKGDARGGTGHAFDWGLLEGFPRKKPLVLAGGLKPDTVEEAIQRVKPDAVDTASGVESKPSVKDQEKTLAFIQNARKAAAKIS